jgi:glyoxylase I family protein
MNISSPVTLLVVNDLQISKDFYLNFLNLKLVEEHLDCIKMQTKHHPIIMFQGTDNSVDYQHGFNANSTLVFAVECLDNRIAELKSKGVSFIHESPNKNRWGRYSAFKDTSGIIHELMELF